MPEQLFALQPQDGPAYEWYGQNRISPYLVVCDHARNRIPACFGDMGLTPAQLNDHIAWDQGSEPVGRYLADMLGAPCIASGFSRLVLDVNRFVEDEGQIPASSDGVALLPNQNISQAEREARQNILFHPYHNAIVAHLDAVRARGQLPIVISVHSFTPQLASMSSPRPWQVGILWREDLRLAGPVMAALRARGDIVVGDNQPYDRRTVRTPTVEAHAEDVGLPNLLVELRRDGIETEEGQRHWAKVLFEALQTALPQFEIAA